MREVGSDPGELDGRRVAALVETEFVPQEIDPYRTRFRARGATVDFVSALGPNAGEVRQRRAARGRGTKNARRRHRCGHD